MGKIKRIISIVIAFVVILSCSTRKDAFLNRNYHAMSSKYNILYNGHLAFFKGIEQVEDNYKDNFWKRLSIEPLKFKSSDVVFKNSAESDRVNVGAADNLTYFDKAEDKAVKAIQRHGMNIARHEKNSQIDDAYLLLGKSRYYTQRFIPAIEAFNYIIANYPDANLNYETRVWRAKSNIRLGNDELAIETMKLLLDVLDKSENVPPRIIEEAYTTMAMAYSHNDSINKLVYYLKKATQTSYNKQQTGRNLFILGQVYNELNQVDSARFVFERLVEKRVYPNKYRVHAHIELAKTYVNDTSNSTLLINKFKKLIKNTDNRKYFDELYYHMAVLYDSSGDKQKAIKYYNKSLRQNSSSYQKTFTFQRLGDIYFNDKKYLIAQSFYDSVSQVVPEEFAGEKRIRRIKKMNKGLDSLKEFEQTISVNDSILFLVRMTKDQQEDFFNKHIEHIKKEDELRRQQLANSNSFNSGISSLSGSIQGWYFYNKQSVQIGESEFKRIWGQRKLKDNWRWSSNENYQENDDFNQTDQYEKVPSRYQISTYLDAIPTDPKEISKLEADRNNALYKAALIYKEQFKNYKLAIDRLERLNTLPVDRALKLPMHYHLYHMYKIGNEKHKSDLSKRFIEVNYPNSSYLSLLNGDQKKEQQVIISDYSKKYKELYSKFTNEAYSDVICDVDFYLEKHRDFDLVAKFKLLRALSIGKIHSKEKFAEELAFIVSNYKTTAEGKRAKELIELLKK